ncbi:MAG: hypothetical protein OXG44_05105, partial [Gammaproteobacteria bacterium]|nr:hypothetical protein [Gammaproteobacteria bacterium]
MGQRGPKSEAQQAAYFADIVRPVFRPDSETAKDRQRSQLEADVAAFLASGRKITRLKSFADECDNPECSTRLEPDSKSRYCSPRCRDRAWYLRQK